MSTYETISLMIAFAMLIVALLAYIDRNNKRKQKINCSSLGQLSSLFKLKIWLPLMWRSFKKIIAQQKGNVKLCFSSVEISFFVYNS